MDCKVHAIRKAMRLKTNEYFHINITVRVRGYILQTFLKYKQTHTLLPRQQTEYKQQLKQHQGLGIPPSY